MRTLIPWHQATAEVHGEDTDHAADANHEGREHSQQLRGDEEHAEQLRLCWHEADIDPCTRMPRSMRFRIEHYLEGRPEPYIG
jgi:hypothetical protein